MVAEGLVEVYKNAGFEVRQPGCSSCLAMNEDKIPQGNMQFLHPTGTLKEDRAQVPGLCLQVRLLQLLLQ